jgi:hypothetical protein
MHMIIDPSATLKDPQILFLKKRSSVSDDYPFKYDIFYYSGVNASGAKVEQQVNLCGFSFFGELGGLPYKDDAGHILQGIDLWSSTEVSNPPYPVNGKLPIIRGGRYVLSFDNYLDALHSTKTMHPAAGETRINFARLFLFPPYQVRRTPFEEIVPGKKWNPLSIDGTYLNCLDEFIVKARSRGIVVCLSFFCSQMLRGQAWQINPFNAANNDKGFIGDKPLVNFFDIQDLPPGKDPSVGWTYDDSWTPQQKLFWAQRNLVHQVVQRTKRRWNVIYEIFNEPMKARDGNGNEIPGSTAKILNWFTKTVTWLNQDLLDPGGTARSRLISITAGDDLRDDLFNALNIKQNAAPGLVDILSLHGGGGGGPSQWGGFDGNMLNGNQPADPSVCTTAVPPPTDEILNGKQGQPDKGLNNAITQFAAYPLALIFDSDSHYWAQRVPGQYIKQVLSKNGSFAYRWSDVFLHEVNEAGQVVAPNVKNFCQPPANNASKTLGLYQRLDRTMDAPAALGLITIFPFPPSPQARPQNLTIAKQANTLKIKFSPVSETIDGYIVFFGPYPPEVGDGTSLFPGMVFINGTSLDIGFTPPSSATTLYVAVAARNGLVHGNLSKVLQVDLP